MKADSIDAFRERWKKFDRCTVFIDEYTPPVEYELVVTADLIDVDKRDSVLF